jgi:hypothetical protein
MINWQQGSTWCGAVRIVQCVALMYAGWTANLEQIAAIVASGEAIKGIIGITKED